VGDGSEIVVGVAVIIAVFGSFFVSASAGLGGSLVLVPTLALVLGTKEGVALAALLLGSNNIVKLVAYRATLPVAAASKLVVLTVLGTFIGAKLLVATPDAVVTIAVIVSFAVALVAERRRTTMRTTTIAPALSFAAGTTSGFSGTSGPLKGVAVRSLGLDRLHTVGAAALVSAFGDITKAVVFTEAQLLGRSAYLIAVASIPLMLGATLLGRRFNQAIGERRSIHSYGSGAADPIVVFDALWRRVRGAIQAAAP